MPTPGSICTIPWTVQSTQWHSYLTIFNCNYRHRSEFSNICMLHYYRWVNTRTFGRVVHIRKVLIITGTSSKIREMKRVYAFLNIHKYDIWPTNTYVHVRKFQIIFDEVCAKNLRNGILYSWFRASWLCINKIQQDATVCRYLFTASLLYMFWVSIAPIIRSTKNSNCSLWYSSYYETAQQPSSNVA